jgi:LCP family protein required for cell wall assembly
VKKVIAFALVFSGLLMAVAIEGGLVSAGGQEPAFTIQKIDQAHFSGTSGLTFMLAIGDDGRAGVGGNRGDALHLIGVNPKERRATMLDIPRDTWVDIPGHGQQRINAALEFGGAELQARTVSQLTGIPIAFTIKTNFDGLIGMVDDLGGVDVDVPQRMADPNSGAFFEPGINRFDGHAALAFSRNRHIGSGDLTRTYNQGLLILAGLRKLRANQSPSAVVHALNVLLRRGQANGVGPTDLYRLGKLALSIDPNNVKNVVMPARIGQVGAASVVFVGPGADSLFADMRDDAILQAH